jgi:hypothetical protein
MSGHARHVAPLGPAPVAVHDDGDVFGQPCRIQMPVNFGFLAVEPRGYFVVQSGHDMRLPQGGRGCNDKRGMGRVARAVLPVRDAETIFNYVAQFALGPRERISKLLIMPLPKQVFAKSQ